MDKRVGSHQVRRGDPVPGPAGTSARLLVLGDTHGDAGFIQRALRAAADEGCDGALQLGDFGLWPDLAFRKRTGQIRLGQRYLDEVASYASAYGMWLRFIDGNHDAHPLVRADYPELTDGTGIRPIRSGLLDWADRGSIWEWCGVRLGALGGAFSIDKARRTEGSSWWPTETITQTELDRLASRGPLDVLLTHDAPAEVFVPGHRPLPPELESAARENRFMVSRAVAASKPTLLLHGHHHVAHRSAVDLGDGGRTRVIGVASNIELPPDNRGILSLPSLDYLAI